METNYIISSFVLIPLLGFVFSLFMGKKSEDGLARLSFYTVLLQFIFIFAFVIYWLFQGAASFNIKELVIYQSDNYEFVIDFYFDYITASYLLLGSFVTVIIIRYSSYYMHMEPGFKRFFNTVLFFFFGYNFTVLSGNFETLFIGWEILGMSSFLLIAFYRERYLPTRNAVKVFSIYRIGDVGILLAMWASHHLWHENITFQKLNDDQLVHEHLMGNSAIGLFIAACVLIAAAAKAAQFPFSSWLPRAMEGPTPSSAIFYGSLSVHLGVFLLLRTFPFWEEQIIARVLIGLCGLTTAVLAYFIARVQSTIKTQIAYASIVQIGLMFVEISLGWTTLALVHASGNALLRTYQLLVSPSVVSYAIRDQIYHSKAPSTFQFPKALAKFEYALYAHSINEWGMDSFMNKWVFSPLKKTGKLLNFINLNVFLFGVLPFFALCVVVYAYHDLIPLNIHQILPYCFATIAVLLVLKGFSERKDPLLVWLLVLMNHYWIALAISFNELFDWHHTLLFLSGTTVMGVVGLIVLLYMKKFETNYFALNRYYGHVYEYKKSAFIFLLATMGLMGFPITMSFIGEDLIYSHIHIDQIGLAILYAISYIMGGIALVRLFARIFLGPHVKSYHEKSPRSF